MSRAKKKIEKKSLYDSFYGKWPNEITVNKVMKCVEEQVQDYVLRYMENKIKTQVPVPQDKNFEKLRATIRKAAKGNKESTLYGEEKNNNTPIISDVVRIKDVKDFTNETHSVKLALQSAKYYNEEITTKIVGMETVDWWEYILLYGFFKSFKLGYEYTKVKEFIDKGVKSTRTVCGQNIEITFIPKQNDVKENFVIIDGQRIIRKTGTLCDTAVISLEVPQKQKPETHEYRKGYFVYEDSFSTLVIDFIALKEQIEKMLTDRNVHPTLIEEIKNNLNNGRLSRI